MRGCVPEYELIAPASLAEALQLLHAESGAWRPIAGGTDLMVVYESGRLPFHKLMSIWKIPELRGINVSADAVSIGAVTTYTHIRRHPVLQSDFPLLCQAASWTGSIANQNRGTLGGNIVNASPAADSPPALIVYDAELELISRRGIRTISLDQFYTGYKKLQLAPDELLYRIRLPRNGTALNQYSRKVGTRKAQAISKVCLAARATMDKGAISEIRIALGSVAPTVLRCRQTEDVLLRRKLDPIAIQDAKAALLQEIAPIADIRSTADYRQRVTLNLLDEFLHGLLL